MHTGELIVSFEKESLYKEALVDNAIGLVSGLDGWYVSMVKLKDTEKEEYPNSDSGIMESLVNWKLSDIKRNKGSIEALEIYMIHGLN